jgi:hypothetical protein
MKRLPWAVVMMLVACSLTYKYKPPAPPTSRDATVVNASMGRTWDAVIDLFAARTIPIRTIERVSSIIVTDQLTVGSEGKAYADCGEFSSGADKSHLTPNFATYNVLVRGDSTSSTVKVTVGWSLRSESGASRECSTTHVWEKAFESDVKTRSEGMRATSTSSTHPPPAASPSRVVEPSPAPAPPRSPVQTTSKTSSTNSKPKPSDTGPAQALRTNAELRRETSFDLAAGDSERLGIVESFRESGPDTLTVQLTDSAFTANGTDRILSHLYSAYLATTSYDAKTILLFLHGTRVVGEYTNAGLTKGAWE